MYGRVIPSGLQFLSMSFIIKRNSIPKNFHKGKKIGGAGASISCTAFEKVGHIFIIPISKSYSRIRSSVFDFIFGE